MEQYKDSHRIEYNRRSVDSIRIERRNDRIESGYGSKHNKDNNNKDASNTSDIQIQGKENVSNFIEYWNGTYSNNKQFDNIYKQYVIMESHYIGMLVWITALIIFDVMWKKMNGGKKKGKAQLNRK